MDIAGQIGQLFMVGFEGYTCDKELSDLIVKHGIGGVILFERNIGQLDDVIALTNTFREMSRTTPLFVAIDQEGGRVARLKEPFTQFPSPSILGRCFQKDHSVRTSYRFGEIIARELRAVGITVDLAPVLDVNTNPKNPVIGDRALGVDPLTVSELGLAMIAGFQDNGVMACGKHFPGHGDTVQDSHSILPRVDHDLDRLTQIEMRPFVHAIRNGLSCLMTAHVLYSHLDDRRPATLSEKIITRLLRKVLGYSKLVITDDLEMKAIEDEFNIEDAAVEALKAGADILLICHTYEKQVRAWEAVLKAVNDGRLSKDHITRSVERISQIKKYFLKNLVPADPKEAVKIIGCREHREAARTLREYAETSTEAPAPASGGEALAAQEFISRSSVQRRKHHEPRPVNEKANKGRRSTSRPTKSSPPHSL